MLQGMRWWRVLLATCLATALALPAAAVGLADTATADLIAAPPAGPWQLDPQSGPMSKSDIYGSDAGSVKEFVDSYRKVWTTDNPRRIIADRLERYSSTFWAAFRYGESHSASQKNKHHTSVDNVSGFGPNAYEATDPADSNGFLRDTIVFQQGDYIGVIAVYDQTQPDRATLLDQTQRQFDAIPLPVGEYNAIGHGITNAILVIVAVAGGAAVIVAAIILIVVLRNRRAAQPQPAGALRLSPDRSYWWDGQSWQDASRRMPAGAQLSPDGTQWWDGVSWRPRPPS